MRRRPTEFDFASYDGAHTPLLWKAVGENWQCPACKRNKFEILRWTKRRHPKTGLIYWGWIAPLHTHHDHSGKNRFPPTIICDQCNVVDGVVKKRLGLPGDFSFAPRELVEFIVPAPHSKHEIDYQKAANLAIGLGLFCSVRGKHKNVQLRISSEILAQIDNLLARRGPLAQSRHQWFLEAIVEKIEKSA